MILKQAKNEDTEILKHKCDEIVNIVQVSPSSNNNRVQLKRTLISSAQESHRL